MPEKNERILHVNEYRAFIKEMGVGDNDLVASSPDSYISYLNSVSKILNCQITPDLLKNDQDILDLAYRLKGSRADKTIQNYKAAMRQYVHFSKQFSGIE